MALRNKVTLIVDRDFFEKTFNPPRKELEKQLGTKVSQTDFSRILFKSKVSLKPNLNFDMDLDMKLRRLKRNIKPKQRRKIGIKKTNK